MVTVVDRLHDCAFLPTKTFDSNNVHVACGPVFSKNESNELLQYMKSQYFPVINDDKHILSKLLKHAQSVVSRTKST